MGKFIAEKTVKMMLNGGVEIKRHQGWDSRSHLHQLVTSQQSFEYAGVELADWRDFQELGSLIIARPHKQYRELSGQAIVDNLKPGRCVIDVRSMLDVDEMKGKRCNFWRL